MSVNDKRARLRTRVDGYNFYYGCLKGTHFKWLDLFELFERHVLPSVLVRRDEITVNSQLLPQRQIKRHRRIAQAREPVVLIELPG